MDKAEIAINQEEIISRIYYIRGQKIMLDRDLALLYGVPTKRINEQVKRNLTRFEGYIFQLNEKEFKSLQSQFATANISSKSRTMPFAFTEHGLLMLSTVLNSEIAIKVSRQIIQIFIQLREMINSNKKLREQLELLERKCDQQFKVIFEAIRHILIVSENPKKIGFMTEEKK